MPFAWWRQPTLNRSSLMIVVVNFTSRLTAVVLVDELPCESIALVPVRARGIGAPFALVIDALLVRATHQAVGHDD